MSEITMQDKQLAAEMLQTIQKEGKKVVMSANTEVNESLFPQKGYKPSEVEVLVDSKNMDSLMAWALFRMAGHNSVMPTAYVRNSDNNQFAVNRAFVIFGVEVTAGHLQAIYERSEDIVIFAYAGSYEWLKERQYSKMLDKIKVYWPYADTEMEQSIIDNCISKMLRLRLPDVAVDSEIAKYVDDVSRYMNLVQLLRNSALPFSPTRRAGLHDIMRMLTTAHMEIETLDELNGYVPQEDVVSYIRYNKQIRLDLQRNMHKVIYGAGPKRLMVTTMSVSGEKYHDYLTNMMMSEDGFIGYYDEPYGRVWRVYCKNPSHVAMVEEFLKPSQVWMEGIVRCMETKRPEFQP